MVNRAKWRESLIQCYDIIGGKHALGKLRQEQFVNHTRMGDPDPTLGLPGRMGRHNKPTPHTLRPQRQIRAVVERALSRSLGGPGADREAVSGEPGSQRASRSDSHDHA